MPQKLFLEYSSFREEWKVLDIDRTPYGTGDSPEEAIRSARIITNAPIYANSDFKALIDGEPLLKVRYADEILNETTLYGAEEMMEAMAEISGLNVYKVYDDNHVLMGYTFEVVE